MFKKGFTLIELLIVVAIIAILAAIAVPNFLEAQVRAKVSRAKSDLRSFATAVEAYAVDHNKPPPQSKGTAQVPTPGTIFSRVEVGGQFGTGTLTYAVTTPIAYITNFIIMDPFANNDIMIPIDERLFTYQAVAWVMDNPRPLDAVPTPVNADPYNEQMSRAEFTRHNGAWRMLSIGPDRTFYNGDTALPIPTGLPYDPTNGTISMGNIVRSQAQTEQKTWFLVP